MFSLFLEQLYYFIFSILTEHLGKFSVNSMEHMVHRLLS